MEGHLGGHIHQIMHGWQLHPVQHERSHCVVVVMSSVVVVTVSSGGVPPFSSSLQHPQPLHG